MDLDEWEVIPSTKPYLHVSSKDKELLSFLGPDLLVEADYFKCPTPGLCPSPSPSEHQQQEEEKEDEEEEEYAPKEFKDIGISTEFREETKASAPAPTPPVNWLEPDPMVFSQGTIKTEKEEVMSMSMQMERKEEVVVEEEKDCTGFNLWGLRVHGIGAICSFGVATAATLCVFALGTASASATGRVQPSPNIQFQIFADDKRIKDVVQRATGLNHAITAARGITIPTAQISFGGHYEGL